MSSSFSPTRPLSLAHAIGSYVAANRSTFFMYSATFSGLPPGPPSSPENSTFEFSTIVSNAVTSTKITATFPSFLSCVYTSALRSRVALAASKIATRARACPTAKNCFTLSKVSKNMRLRNATSSPSLSSNRSVWLLSPFVLAHLWPFPYTVSAHAPRCAPGLNTSQSRPWKKRRYWAVRLAMAVLPRPGIPTMTMQVVSILPVSSSATVV
mmetsp:Transcript_23176/g.47388  ORF Transcript_23176/g.47388 Transcript_23176/m.47388 type:complete len:211 (-) Transcript_23176:328-960(-)